MAYLVHRSLYKLLVKEMFCSQMRVLQNSDREPFNCSCGSVIGEDKNIYLVPENIPSQKQKKS
jgi:hypothetical protein